MLSAVDVDCGYGSVPVLQGASISIGRGRIVGLRGPSGTGKTTIARTLTGLLPPLRGAVTLDGEPLRPRRGRHGGRVAMLFQSPRRSCDPRHTLARIIGEPLNLGRGPGRSTAGEGRPAGGEDVAASVVHAAAQVGLTPDLLQRLPAQVSDGQLQRAALARALLQRPDYLVCDEATAMLDAVSTAVLAGLLRDRAQQGVGVLAISHDAALLQAWADEVLDLAEIHGPIRAGG